MPWPCCLSCQVFAALSFGLQLDGLCAHEIRLAPADRGWVAGRDTRRRKGVWVSTIAVGVDGSPGSLGALRWAVAEARHHGSVVRAVHAWQLPYHQGYVGHLALGHLREPLIEAARQTLHAALADPCIETAGVEIMPVVEEGSAARVLIAAGADAGLLVVGSRGYGGFRGLLLGSVSQQCAQGAPCPLVIVPGERRGADAADGGADGDGE